MPQRCSHCGKTEKQHSGKPCVDVAGFKKALREIQAGHTPGPWTADWDDSGQWYVNIGGLSVSGNALRGDSGECIESANAHLISAAPELLQGLKDIWEMFDKGDIVRNIANDHSPDWPLRMLQFTQKLKAAHAAIVKAEGNE